MLQLRPETNVNRMIEKFPAWKCWKPWGQCTEEEKATANMRQILPNEIVLDVEEMGRYDSVKRQLKKAGFEFISYETGSRGCHFHLFFDRDVGNEERRAFIRAFHADESKASGNTMIAFEERPHFKTGNVKRCIEVTNGASDGTLNKVAMLPKVKAVREERRPLGPITPHPGFLKDRVFTLALMNPGDFLSQNGMQKNPFLFKHCAIVLELSGIPDEQKLEYAERIAAHCHGHRASEIIGWIQYFRQKNKHPRINDREVARWLKQHNLG